MLRNLAFVVQFAYFSIRATIEQLSLQKATFYCFLTNFWATFWEITGKFLENLKQLVESPASYPDVSLLMKMCAQRKAGRTQRARRRFACRLYPSHGSLRFITSQEREVQRLLQSWFKTTCIVFYNNISAGHTSLLQVYRCYWTYVAITILYRWRISQ